MTDRAINTLARKLVAKAMKANATLAPARLIEAVEAKGGEITEDSAKWLVYRTEFALDPSLKIPATVKSVVRARAKKMRWERIVVRANLASVAKAQEMFEEGGGVLAESYIGRGRKPVAA